ncbi:hypothetical protein CDAR_68811 [Caerostris darwini]|uniref:DNA-directed primase/polymerase protein n=1 Tax=Caerostris darwini TaxID=1538125 RepID=A0AAV4WXK8_9ARAC|nr:hypothetical protein CDAR_68811 [Caerostris darwini]
MSSTSKSDNHLETVLSKFYKPTAGAWSESILHLRKTYKEHKAKPIPPTFEFRLDGPSVSWKVFRHLIEAISYAKYRTKDCMVFSYEERIPESSGQRLFLVTHPQHMWLNHKSRPVDERCTYEVIQENFPCKLYFDLEFNKILNPDKDGIKMTEIFIKCIIASMVEDFNTKCSASDVLWLDASTEKKYSCHLILQMNDCAFKNNFEAGDFVSLLFSKIKRKIDGNINDQCIWPTTEELKYLFVQDKEGNSINFCDEGVYTKNRNFRLFLSTKYGKRAPLLLSQYNQYVPNKNVTCKDKNEAIFYDSLVTYFRNGNVKLLSYDLDEVPVKIPRRNISPKNKLNFSGSNSKSPYPEVDVFVSSIIKDDLGTGFIRKWSYLQAEEILVYEIGNYRFCNNIGRHHKSNNIMIIVDMKKKIYYQKCHDPQCRAEAYKSSSSSLPENIVSLYSLPDDFFENDCFSQLGSNSEDLQNPVHESSDVIEDDSICQKFFEDISLDAYPFTQLCSGVSTNCNRINKESSITNTVVESQSLEESFLEDTSFDDLCVEDLETDFVKHISKKEKSSSSNSAVPLENTFNENSVKSANGEDLSFEDELMMAEAAAAIEVTMGDATQSEETIF